MLYNIINTSNELSHIKDDFKSVLCSLIALMFIKSQVSLYGMQIDVICLQTTYLIFEAFQILFPSASLIFTVAKLFHQVIWERTKHNKSSLRCFTSIMAVDKKLWIYFLYVVTKCSYFVMSCMKQNRKCKQTLESV